MAQGDFTLFNAYEQYKRDGAISLSGTGWRVILCSDSVAALTAAESNPARGSTNINEVSAGGGYSTDGIAITTDNQVSGGLYTFKLDTTVHSGGTLGWPKAASSPGNIRTAVLIDTDATSPIDAAIGFWDMTEDGSTPISLVAVDINLNCGAGEGNPGEIFTDTVNVS